MTIRIAMEEDALAISHLVSSLSHYYCDASNSELPVWFSESITPAAIHKRISSQDYCNYVYVCDEAIVGYAAIKDSSHLYHLFVASEYQGRGIARRLWQHVSNESQARQFTVRSSLYAVPVYECFGFRPSGPVGGKDGIAYQAMEYKV